MDTLVSAPPRSCQSTSFTYDVVTERKAVGAPVALFAKQSTMMLDRDESTGDQQNIECTLECLRPIPATTEQVGNLEHHPGHRDIGQHPSEKFALFQLFDSFRH